ncbi:uncharacterized LOC4343865 [Oryza sativa Japonica Group]|uniref:Os07g0608100 protein n=8 Tax=Oryza TaxID=4527 RepID=A3BM17_ORYSJ|nr:uncharacterized LOC4343865 [Oryza sativa Japonica Group]XP_015646565.1 uncharacterized protein LOC4343865 isoform X2 [Oryza sativa Japonica Group]XP_052162263.1 uncharacterized protein LOC127779503 [Oryza glaberrima]EAZ04664.1 hypothetical protein OsI_26816 [Oryza sativa Indica Group]EAZ40606.1 hypothetical protein OsJ_25067 [Oryza sativa Japonica Group]BAC84850.1 unknown protein [Oryza sativa Japonica Group]BAF22153.1 Os07g0608100 [Oryza sativa Japonica Group]BAG90810.1 unnamed protein p|eukprot:NP_001060239.1 Os07g0608100 [Oryza sativa Japonica Group]
MLAYLLHAPAAAAAVVPSPLSLRSPPKTPFLPTSPIRVPTPRRRPAAFSSAAAAVVPIAASLLEGPVLVWAGRLCLYYALLHIGLAGSPRNPFLAHEIGDDGAGDSDLGFSKWADKLRGGAPGENEAQDKRKLVSKWKPTTKGTLKRTYRVRSVEEGRRILKEIALVLSEDDHFVDASSHKGCQIRRESAHGESVCCYNVRALFDELPTPHLVLEITAFPAGPLTDNDYRKAERLEMVLRMSASI